MDEDQTFVEEIWKPMLTRTVFVKLGQEMPKEETYSVNQLAHALQHLYNQAQSK